MTEKPDALRLADLLAGLTEKQLSLHPYCNDCGWRKGGLDSWNGVTCKCGHVAPTFSQLLRAKPQPDAGTKERS